MAASYLGEVGEALTEREQEVLSLADSGMSDQDLADYRQYRSPGSQGYASSNAAGNVRRRAMHKAGRGGEVQRRTAQAGSAPRPRGKSVEDTVVDPVQQMRDVKERALSQLDQFRSERDQITADLEADQEAVLDSERERLMQIVQEAQERLNEFDEWSEERQEQFFKAHRQAAQSRFDGNHEHLDAAITKAEAAIRAADAFFEAMGVSDEPELDEEQDEEQDEQES